MTVPTSMQDLSTNESLNSPAGPNAIGNSLDNFLRSIQAIIRTTNAKGADIAAAATTNIAAATAEFVDVTGSATITSLGSISAGICRTIRFTGSPTLVNSANIVLPGAANYSCSPNDVLSFRSLGSGAWVCTGVLNRPVFTGTFPVVDYVQGIRGLDSLEYSSAFVLGYYAAGDGGGGQYYLDAADTTSADNGGSIIVANDGARWKLIHNGAVSFEQFGAIGNGSSNDSSSVQSCISDTTVKVVCGRAGATYLCQSQINLASDKVYYLNGAKIKSGGQQFIISMNGVNDCFFYGGEIEGDGVTAIQTGIRLKNSSRNKFYLTKISAALNKGFEVSAQSASSETAVDNEFISCAATGATSTTGGGLSIFGDTATNNKVIGGNYSSNRIGVTINGAHHNTIVGATCDDNTLMGITVDGIVTSGGDGGRYNNISDVQCNRNLGAAFGGIFVGNGSSYNVISNAICNDNTGAGYRVSGGVGFEPSYNKVSNSSFGGNGANGVTLSFANRNEFIGVTSSGNTGRGMSCFNSDYISIIGGKYSTNTTDGIIIQSGYTRTIGAECVGNGGYGFRVTTGGSADSTGNIADLLTTSGNATANIDISSGDLCRVTNSSGFSAVTANAGDANATYRLGSPTTIIYNSPITATRSVVLSTTAPFAGDKVNVVRTAAATGAFNVNVGTGPLKALAAGQWCTVEYSGAAWVLTAFGAL